MTTTIPTHDCTCGGALVVLNRCGASSTAACQRCQCCWLLIDHPNWTARIALADFHLKRGEASDQRPLTDLTMAIGLVESLIDDALPSPATIVDYGIDSRRHLRALRYVVREGVTAYDLDRVIGDGPAITRLVRSVPGQPEAGVDFRTVYDDHDWTTDGWFGH